MEAEQEVEHSRSAVVDTPAWYLPVRIAQIVLSLIVFALTAAVLGLVEADLDAAALGVAVAVVTWVFVGWYIFYTRSKAAAYHPIAVLVCEIILMILWLSTFAVLADRASNLQPYTRFSHTLNEVYDLLAVAAAVSAAVWVLFVLTLVTFSIFYHHHTQAHQGTAGIEGHVVGAPVMVSVPAAEHHYVAPVGHEYAGGAAPPPQSIHHGPTPVDTPVHAGQPPELYSNP